MRTLLKISIPPIASIELLWPLTQDEWQRMDDILKAYRLLSEYYLMPDDKEILSQEIMKSTME